jgi:hypothetical protein
VSPVGCCRRELSDRRVWRGWLCREEWNERADHPVYRASRVQQAEPVPPRASPVLPVPQAELAGRAAAN